MRTVLLLALGVLALVVVFRLALPRLVPFFVFYPEPLRPRESHPRHWGFPDAREATLRTADGVALHAWWFPARTGADRRCGVAVYFHGNAGNLASRGEVAAGLAELGLDVLLFDYRGYGLSEGKPSEEGLGLDADAAYRHALSASGLPPERIALVGNSLGSAVAVRLAARQPVGVLVLVGPFTSTVAVARHVYRWLPPWMLEWDTTRFEALEAAGRVRAPALVARAGEDRMISREDAREVFEALAGEKRWLEVPGAAHNGVFGAEPLWRAMRAFLGERLGCA